jgi:hypothetical protein
MTTNVVLAAFSLVLSAVVTFIPFAQAAAS